MQLEPCPFCESEAHIERLGDRRQSTQYNCDNCGCFLETGEEWDHGKQWNRRPVEEKLRTKLAIAKEAQLDAESTLDAWFDRRRLAHDKIDEEVLQSVRGFLRTCSSGGMPKKKIDTVMAAIEEMVRLSMFADLFARAMEKEDAADNGTGSLPTDPDTVLR